MANAEINDLTNKVTPLSTDEVEIQATAGGASNKATLANVSKAITITKSQVSDFSDGDYATAAQGSLADSATQPGDNISTLTNDSGFTSNTGDVVGPASSTDNAIARYNLTTGKLLQDSSATISDTGSLSVTNNLSAPSGTVEAGAGILSNTVSEYTAASGVTVDGVLIKDGEVDGRDVGLMSTNLETFTLPASTTISAFGATLVDDATNTDARSTLGLGTLATANNINNSNWSGTDLSVANGGTGASTHTSGNYLKGNGTSAITSSTPAAVAAEIGALLYPVGSYYINETNSTNPGTLLGFGTWTAVTDTFIVGRGATYTGTGGSATHTHSLSSSGQAQITLGGTTLQLNRLNTGFTGNIQYSASGGSSGSYSTGNSTGLQGSTDSGDNIPPYQAAYVWKRTA